MRRTPRHRRGPSTAFEPLESRRLLSTGDLDPTFGTGGVLALDQPYSPDIHVTDAALQPDGKIIEVGELGFQQLALARLNTDGTLDPTFTPPYINTDTRLKQFLSEVDVQNASVAIQPDGKIIVGVQSLNQGNFYVLRFDATGALDRSFGRRGVAGIDFGSNDFLTDVTVQPDGKIVAAGYTSVPVTNPDPTALPLHDNDFALARLNADGSPDRSFGRRGLVTTDLAVNKEDPRLLALTLGSKAASLALQGDGKIVLAGSAPEVGLDQGGVSAIGVARYNTDGSLDTAFADAGLFQAGTGAAGAYGSDVAIDKHGRITIGGFSFSEDSLTRQAKTLTLLRVTARGRADRSFGDAGVVTGAAGATGGAQEALTVYKDGTVVVAVTPDADSLSDPRVFRYQPDGSPDPAFGSGGAAALDGAGAPRAVLPYRDGGVAVVTDPSLGGGQKATVFTAARFDPDGQPVPSFGDAGRAAVPLVLHGKDTFGDLFARADGRLVVHGGIEYNSLPVTPVGIHDKLRVLRSDGSPDASVTPVDAGHPVAVQADGKMIAADIFDPGSNNQTGFFGVHRYNPDGTPDASFGAAGSSALGLDIHEIQFFSRVAVGPGGRIVTLSFRSQLIEDSPEPYQGELVAFSADGQHADHAAIDGATQGAADEFNPIDLAYQSDGRIVVLGTRYHRPADGADPTSTEIEVRRYGTDLTLQSTFALPASPGLARFSLPRALAVGPGDKITVIGTTGRRQKASSQRLILIRYNADGTPDTTFANTGTLTTDVTGPLSNVLVQGDGKPVLAVNTPTGPEILRFTNTGAFDTRLDGDGILDANLGPRATIGKIVFDPDGKLVAGGTLATGRHGRNTDLLLARYDW